MPPQLDHVILLLPYRDIVNPPEWLTQHFTISPGGRHADGKTENRLVLFQDGTYLELIAFIDDDPTRRQGHWWDRKYGIVDYALTTSIGDDVDVAVVNQRLSSTGTRISYLPSQEGGRVRPDGVELKWRVTFPQGIQRGAVPFWCTDVTPRERRVPLDLQVDGSAATTHPCGATGMAGVTIEAGKPSLSIVRDATAAILDLRERGADLDLAVAVPRVVHRGSKTSTIRVREAAESVPANEFALTLAVRTSREIGNIARDVDGGKVSISFERS